MYDAAVIAGMVGTQECAVPLPPLFEYIANTEEMVSSDDRLVSTTRSYPCKL